MNFVWYEHLHFTLLLNASRIRVYCLLRGLWLPRSGRGITRASRHKTSTYTPKRYTHSYKNLRFWYGVVAECAVFLFHYNTKENVGENSAVGQTFSNEYSVTVSVFHILK